MISLIVFLHVSAAAVWVGGMVILRGIVHRAIATLSSPTQRLEVTFFLLERFLQLVFVCILVLLGTALYLVEYWSLLDMASWAFYGKILIFTLMLLVYTAVVSRLKKAQNTYANNDVTTTVFWLRPIARWMIPLNILLGAFIFYLGILLRGL